MSKKETVFWVPPVFGDDGEQLSAGIGSDGKEYPDPVPFRVPVQEQVPPHDIFRTIREVMASEYLQRKADEEGFDTPEEADDFADEDDDYELSPYQRSLMEKDLNPSPAVSLSEDGPRAGAEKPEGGATPPPVMVNKQPVESGPGSIVSSGVGSSDIAGKVVPTS